MAQLVKNPPAMWETWVPSLGWDRVGCSAAGVISQLLRGRPQQSWDSSLKGIMVAAVIFEGGQ